MIIIWLIVFGLIFGSFINALVYRLHEQAALEGKQSAAAQRKREQLSMTKGRSMCSKCGHELATQDLVPFFSWLWLRGRCRYCKQKIADNPLVELTVPVLFVVSYLLWPYELSGVALITFGAWLASLVAGVALAVYDQRWYTLPDKIVWPLTAITAVAIVVVAALTGDWGSLIGPAIGAILLSGTFYILYQISDGTWIGGGDVKLAIALGLWAGGAVEACLVLFIASLLGTLVSLPSLVRRQANMKMQIPFGPFLLLGTLIIVLFGHNILDLLV